MNIEDIIYIDADNVQSVYRELKEELQRLKEKYNIIDFDEGEDDGR